MIKEEGFWKWFEVHSKQYLNFDPSKNQEKLFSELASQLSKIHPDLCFEFGISKKPSKRELVISAGGIKSAFPAVQKIVETAPDMPDWKIIAFRQRKGGNTIYVDGVILKPEDVRFISDSGKNKVDITMYIKGYKRGSGYDTAAYLMLDDVLGEYDVEMYLGEIERTELTERVERAQSITTLPLIIDELKQRLYSIV